MKIVIEVPDKRITELLHGHGGTYSPWLKSLTGKWNGPTGTVVRFDKETDDEGTFSGRKRVQRRAVMLGLATLLQVAPNQFADFMEENDDDICFDCAWQCIVFGKLVYA